MQEISEQVDFENDRRQNMPLCLSINNSNDENHPQIQMTSNTNLPFVRIHAFDIPITNNINPQINNNNLLPTTNTNSREIKPKIEPIKSELNEINNIICGNSNESAQQERNSNTLTPDSQNTQISGTICTREELQIIKCKQCMFLTISRANLDNHISTTHENLIQINDDNLASTKLSCHGCDNQFYSKISFNSHLKHDHFMIDSEISKFLELQDSQNNDTSKTNNIIYLKNVDSLREHQNQSASTPFLSTTLENLNCNDNFVDDGNDFGNDLNFIDLINDDNFVYNGNDDIMIEKLQTKSPQQQKITIKSVENLREPLYLQQVQKNLLGIKTTDSTFDQVGGNKIFSDMNIDCSDGLLATSNSHDMAQQNKTNRPAPKIYIKNVDILKEPIFLPPTNISNILNVNETLHFNNFPLRENSLSVAPSSSHISNSSDAIDNNCNRTFIGNQSNFDYNINNNINQINPTKKNKSKIYIKNVDILKQPQFQTSPTKKCANFLHLRTVDELNLMNKNQINLMNNLQPQNNQEDLNYQPEILYTTIENPKNLEHLKNSKHNNYENLPDTEYVSTNNENILVQSNCNYGFVNLENIVDTTLQKNYQFNSQYDLNIPQFGIDERNTSENEREMLLVCAEELIFSHEKDENNLICSESFIANEVGNKKDTELELTESICDLKKPNSNENVVEIPDDHSCQEKISNFNRNINRDVLSDVQISSEKGRIYVSENLMEDRMITVVHNSTIKSQVLNNVKRPKGRPIGAKTNRANKINNKLDGNNSSDVILKCNFVDCGIRFESFATLEYHKKCHKSNSKHNIECPECFTEEFSNWNSLHTHLWRHHSIDMELYSCELCNFKTPILSRLYNTHMKIHSDERNFKCEQCEKAFKNSKQLKNHRRLHRNWKKPLELHKCEICSAVFSNLKTKKDHFCQLSSQQQAVDQNSISSKCKICDKLCSSKSSLRLHTLSHQDTCKFKCNNCDYITNDHNAFRRHKSIHDKSMMYDCPYCDYKCIQSILYKKHLTAKHPGLASNIIHKCTLCQFTTINQTQFHVHLAKHDNESLPPFSLNNNSGNYLLEDDLESINFEGFDNNKILPVPMEPHQKTKIKVKSDLVLTDPTKFLLQTSNDYVI